MTTPATGAKVLSDDEALQRAGEEWLECVQAIQKRSAEVYGTPWSQDQAGALIAVLAQAGYSYIKSDDLDEDLRSPKELAAEVFHWKQRAQEAEAKLAPQPEPPVSPSQKFGRDMVDAGKKSCEVCGRSWSWVGRDGECGGQFSDTRARCPIRPAKEG